MPELAYQLFNQIKFSYILLVQTYKLKGGD